MRKHSPPLVAWYGYVAGAWLGGDEGPRIVAEAGGWTWTSRVEPEVHAWVRLPWRGVSAAPLPAELARLTPVDRRRGADVTWRVVTPAAGPGFFLVGDAAAVLDPAAAHGVIRGLLSGVMAGHLIAQAIHNPTGEMGAAHAYDRWLSEGFDRDVTRLRALYRALPEPPDWVGAGDQP